MCGICGWYGNNDLSLIRRMVESIRHRGPDGNEVRAVGRHALGAARLAIFGGDEAWQPWAGSGLSVVFNGEIYNYTELSSEVESDGVPISNGESELLARLYQKYGTDFAAKLRGMFAVAIIDLETDRLVLARDPFGIKPLYFVEKNGTLAFASEIKALLQADAVDPEFDVEVLAGLKTFGYVFQQDRTLFRNLRQLEPGTVAVYSDRGFSTTRYYEVPLAKRTPDIKEIYLNEAAERTRLALDDAMCAHSSHGQSPKAFYLSGGIDSTYMASLAAVRATEPITTYTLADNDASEDLQYARKVSSVLGSDHREVRVDLDTYLNALPDYVSHYEHVAAGGVFDLHGGVAFHILSQEIAKDFKVAFSGEGADELFGGYYWTYTHPLGFADRIRARLHAGDKGTAAEAVDSLFPKPEDSWFYRTQLLDWLMRGGLSNYHLCSVDRSCGAFGFEIRPVYLDIRLADEALRLPAEVKLGRDGCQTKLVLKEAARPLFRNLGIEAILTRQKLGMPWAVHTLEPKIEAWAEMRVSNQHMSRHPFRRYLNSKLEVLMFDLFYYIFIARRGVLEEGFQLETFFDSGAHERLYS